MTRHTWCLICQKSHVPGSPCKPKKSSLPGFGRSSRRARNTRYSLYLNQKGRCAYCKQLMVLEGTGDDRVTADHVIPKSKGGSGRRKNIVAACYRCNQEKGDTSA